MTGKQNEIAIWQSVADAAPYLTLQTETSLAQRARMRSTVAHALAEDRVGLVYQPIAATQAGRPVTFYEGLMRLRDTDGTMLLPDAYLPFVENTPLGLELDRVVLIRAIDALAAHPWLRLSINIAPAIAADEAWLETLTQAAQKKPDIAYRLIIEITESSSLFDQLGVSEFLAKLREIGCSVALDDFGAGTTSFRHFRAFRFDMVKIDGSICRGLSGCGDARALVRALVDLARHFEMLTVAEFIETEDDALEAAALGVDCLQGYLIGRPAEDLCNPWTIRDTA